MRNIDLDEIWPSSSARQWAKAAAPAEPCAAAALAERLSRASAATQNGSDTPVASGVVPPPELTAAIDADGTTSPRAAQNYAQPGGEPPCAALMHPAAPLHDAVALPSDSESGARPDDDDRLRDHASALIPIPRPSRAPLVWGGLGFVCGALAWHAIGFWSFVSDVVLNTQDARARSEPLLPHIAAGYPVTPSDQGGAQHATTAAVAVKTTAASGLAKAVCVALVLDRQTGTTRTGDCEDTARDLRDAGFIRRSDRLASTPRLQDANAWSGSTAVEVTSAQSTSGAAQPVAEFGTLTAADIKLDLE